MEALQSSIQCAHDSGAGHSYLIKGLTLNSATILDFRAAFGFVEAARKKDRLKVPAKTTAKSQCTSQKRTSHPFICMCRDWT